jgi:carboxymethylenebutenolidase
MPEITLTASDGGHFQAFHALPSGGTGPAIVLIQEIFGVNAVMRDLATDFASQGYHVLCPDLFWRQSPGVQLTDQSEADWQQAFGFYKGFDEAAGVADLAVTLTAARTLPGATGKVGAVGYCLGGKLAYLMATRTPVDCTVGYYGVGIEAALDEADKISSPLLLHIAGLDGYCPPEAQTAIVDRLRGVGPATVCVHGGVDHAFARVGGAHWNEAAAVAANSMTKQFFARLLKD